MPASPRRWRLHAHGCWGYGAIYVPDVTASRVLVFDASDLSSEPAITVPAGAPGVDDIEAFVRDGRVWIDNPSSQDAAVVNPDGTTQTIDRGTGSGVVNPNAPPAKPSPSTPTIPASGPPSASSPNPTPIPGPSPAPGPGAGTIPGPAPSPSVTGIPSPVVPTPDRGPPPPSPIPLLPPRRCPTEACHR